MTSATARPNRRDTDRAERPPERTPGARRAVFAAVAAAAMALVGAPSAPAQTGITPAAGAMAGAYTTVAHGWQALHWNPANLGLSDRPAVSLGLPHLAAVGAWQGPGLSELRTLLSDSPTDAERQAVLDGMPENGMVFRGDLRVPLGGLSIGPVAVGVVSTAQADANISRELTEMYLYTRQHGNIDESRLEEYRVGDTAFRDAAYTTILAGYGHDAGPLAFGATGRLIIGHEVQRGRLFEPQIDLSARDLIVPALAVRSTSGRGFGIDVGLAARPAPGLTVGASIQNLIGTMSWDDELQLRGDAFSGRDLATMSPDELPERLRESRPLAETGEPPEAYQLAEQLLDRASPPRVVRAGASFELPTATTLATTYSATQGAGDLHVGWPQYLSAGIEQRLPLLGLFALRAGAATSLDGARALTGGFQLGLGPVHFEAAAGRIVQADDGAGSGTPDSATGALDDRLAAGSGGFAQLGIEIVVR